MPKKFSKIKRFIKWLLLSIAMVVVLCNLAVEWMAMGRTINSVDLIPPKKVGLLLGTSRYIESGESNLYYAHRIQAAAKLFKKGKIQFILVSGDNRRDNYNEPRMMYQDLIKYGIPKERIILDYAGFRTLDSVVRCKLVFGETDIIIISQKFHNKRALFIAKWKGMNAVGYNAERVGTMYGLKVNIREAFARVKVVIDLIINKQPHFLGEQIEIK